MVEDCRYGGGSPVEDRDNVELTSRCCKVPSNVLLSVPWLEGRQGPGSRPRPVAEEC